MNTRRTGFTLVELLVVIAIIAILAAILMPAMNAALKKASVAQAQTEVRSIETAVKAYLNEYSRFPHMASGVDYSYGYPAGTAQNGYLMTVLRSIPAATDNGNRNGTNNARRIIFLEASQNSLEGDNFVDPWGSNTVNQYKITVDTDFDNICEPANSIGNVTNRNVIVWCAGPDGQVNTADDITSWK